jgi:hypothetical protein
VVASPNVVSAISRLCEIEPPEITGQGMELDAHRLALTELVRLGGLIHVGNAQALLCLVCDQPHSIAIESAGAGKYRGYCVDSGFQEFREEELRQYRFDENWLARMVASTLGVSPYRAPVTTQTSAVVRIGDCRFGPYRCALFFARRLSERERFDAARSTIEKQTGREPALLFTTTPENLIAGKSPARCAIIQLDDVLRFRGDEASFDDRPVVAALRGTARNNESAGAGLIFSPGFRAASVGGREYRFTKKQALVVEVLWEQHQRGVRQVHQDEIQGFANTRQRVVQLFAGHPAYGALIKNDGEGYYWLDL